MDIELTDKRNKLLAALFIVVMLALIVLTSFYNFYPGGYSLKITGYDALVEKGTFKKKYFAVPLTKENELRIALLKNNIHELKKLWYVSLISMTALVINAMNIMKYKSKIPFITVVVILVVLLMLIASSYLSDVGYIENLLLKLLPISAVSV